MMSVTTAHAAERPPHLLSQLPSSSSNSPFSLPQTQSSTQSQAPQMSDSADVAMATSLTLPPLGQNHDRGAVDLETHPVVRAQGSVVEDARDPAEAPVAMEGDVVQSVRHLEDSSTHTTPPTTTTNHHISHQENSVDTRLSEATSLTLSSEAFQANSVPVSAEADVHSSDTSSPNASTALGTPASPQLEPQPGNQQPPEQENEDSSSEDDDMSHSWQEILEDLSGPSEEELRELNEMARRGDEHSALDFGHWQEKTFKNLQDPDYKPGVYGRIQWDISQFNGTRANPNRERVMFSRVVRIGGYNWKMKFFPRGNETEYISVYIENQTMRDLGVAEPKAPSNHNPAFPNRPIKTPKSRLQPNTSLKADTEDNAEYLTTPIPLLKRVPIRKHRGVVAQIAVLMYNPSEPRAYIYRDAQHRFCQESYDRGFTRFAERRDIIERQPGQRQALLRNDQVSLTAYIRIVEDATDSLWEQTSESHPWDSFTMTGITGLSTTGVWKPGGNLIAAVSSWLLLKPVRQLLYEAQAPAAFKDGYARPKPILLALQRILYGVRRKVRSGPTPPVSIDSIHRALRFYNISTDIGGLDPVRILEILRTKLQEELNDTSLEKRLGQIFGSQKGKTAGRPGYRIPTKQIESIGDAIDNNLTNVFVENEFPYVLQLEMQRQEFDPEEKSWKKLVDKVKLDERISHPKGDYILFGLIVHKGHLHAGEFYSLLRPGGPHSKWLQFLNNNEVHCITKKQALEYHDSSPPHRLEQQLSPVPQIVFYVREDIAAEIFDTTDDEKWDVPANVKALQDQQLEKLYMDNIDIEKTPEKLPASALSPQRVRVFDSSVFNKRVGPGFVDVFGDHSLSEGVYSMKIWPTWQRKDIQRQLYMTIPGVKDAKQCEYYFWWATGSHRISLCNSSDYGYTLEKENGQSKTRHTTGRDICNAIQTRVDAVPILWVCVVPEDTVLDEAKDIVIPDPLPEVQVSNPSNVDTNGDTPMTDVGDDATMDVTATNVGTTGDGQNNVDTEMGGTQDTNLQANAQLVPASAHQEPLKVAAKNILVKQFDPETQLLTAVGSYFLRVNKRVYNTLLGIMGWSDGTNFKVYYEYRAGETYASEIPNIYPNSPTVFDDCDLGYDIAILIVQKTLSDTEKDILLTEGKFADPTSYLEHYYLSTNFPTHLSGQVIFDNFGQEYYEGDILHGVPHGQGTKIDHLDNTYTGTFCLGERHGKGTMTYKNGDTYIGDWVRGKRQGIGEHVEARTGNQFIGNWHADRRRAPGRTNWVQLSEFVHPCEICYDAEGNHAFDPCFHMCACKSCAEQVNVCPKCRQPFKKVTRIYT